MNKLRKSFLLIAFLFLGSGCFSAAKNVVNLSGSTSVQPVMERLAEEFAAGEKSGIKVFVQGGGSSAGIKAVQDGIVDIGMSSRELTNGEKVLNQIEIAKDGIVIAVNPRLDISSLAPGQIRDIFSGRIKNWQKAGGPDHDIVLVTREPGSGTRRAFEELVMKGEAISQSALVQASAGAVKQTVAGTDYSIGYISLTSLDDTVRAVRVNGVPPSVAGIRSGRYLLSRTFLLLTKTTPEGAIKQFIDFVLSERGQKIISEEGLVSVR